MSEYAATLNETFETNARQVLGFDLYQTLGSITIFPPIPTIGEGFSEVVLGEQAGGLDLSIQHIKTDDSGTHFIARSARQEGNDRLTQQADLETIRARIEHLANHPEQAARMAAETF